MALRRVGAYANSIATPRGIVSVEGQLLIANDGTRYIHSQEFMDKWNGLSSDLPATGDTTTSSVSPKPKAKVKKKKKSWFKK
jgi:hypothetical protein